MVMQKYDKERSYFHYFSSHKSTIKEKSLYKKIKKQKYRKEEETMEKKTAVIIGAGPAGLTAAYKLLTETDIKPIILEESEFIGGI